jgi:hypothetical protein
LPGNDVYPDKGEQICGLPVAEPKSELVQIAVKVLHADLVVLPYHATLEQAPKVLN